MCGPPAKGESVLQIKEVADQLNITTRTIRYYEAKGLIAPVKTSNGYRSFTEQ